MTSHVRVKMVARLASVVAYVLAVALCWSPDALTTLYAKPAQTRSGSPAGQSATPLPDGRWLLIGGVGSESLAQVWNPQTGALTTTAGSLVSPRAFHTATVLADGSVLLIGGQRGTAPAEVPELFDPSSGVFVPFSITGSVVRAFHSATLLTDGRVLVAGGSEGGPGLPPTEVWDVEAHTATAISSAAVDRAAHVATLTADGRVLLSGGHLANGRLAVRSDLIDPDTGTVQHLNPAASEPSTPMLAGSLPTNSSMQVPVDAHVALRFSDAMATDSVTAASVSLRGPAGPVDARVIGAEQGRLAFVWPAERLVNATTYTVTVTGATNGSGVPVVPASITFTTVSSDVRDTNAPDEETWTPDASSRANGWRANRPPSPWESLEPLMASPGVTAISGRVLTLDGRPLPNVTFGVEDSQGAAQSDRTGRFLLSLTPSTSGRRVLHIDGSTVHRPNRTYGFFEYGATVAAGQTNVLSFTIWMPALDVAHAVTIPSPTTSEVVITTPYIPGLELHIPPQTILRGRDGQPVRQVTLTPIPVDRPPFPLARNVDVPVYFTAQPGGTYVETAGSGPKGAWLVYPNYHGAVPGQRVQFFHYDPDVKDWYVYGLGSVTPNGQQVAPDPTTRLWEFTGAMINSGNSPPPKGGTAGAPPKADPIDPSSGVFLMHKTDLYLPDVIPLALTRTYNSGDNLARPFGTGMTHPYAMFLWSANEYQEADVILPEGGKIHFVRTSPGTSWTNAILVHQETQTTSATPTPFYKATMRWNGNGWDITLTDGTVFVFGENAPLQAIRDRYGNTVTVTHDNGQHGNVTRVTSPNGRWLNFTYDSSNRVTQAVDNLGRTVSYAYTNGNLTSVTDPANQVTTYGYNGASQITTITDARSITYLTNVYTNGRVTQQTLANGTDQYQLSYTVDGSGNITQTDITDPRGHVERLAFNSDHYIVTDTQAFGDALQRTTTNERQTGSNLVTATTDGLNRRTEYTYDSAGHVLTLTRLAGTADAVTTTFTYEPVFSQLATTTDPLSHTWTTTYDTNGFITGTTDPLGHHTTVTMNAVGQATSVTDALSHTWQVGYAGGDRVSTTNPLGAVWTQFVDAGGRVLSATDPLGHAAHTSVDQLNRPTTLTDPLGGQTAFTYDANSNLLSLTDALTHQTSYTYDSSDRVATRTDPLTHLASYVYDGNSNLTQTTDRKSQVTSRTFDALDRLSQVTFNDASTLGCTYDAGDRMTEITDSINGTITRTYDNLDRLTAETSPEGTVSYAYDAIGRRTTMTVMGQTAVSYGYDNAGRLTSITQGTAVVGITYDDANRRSTLTYPNGIVATSGYDNANELTSLTYTLNGNALGDVNYAYDAAGRRTSISGSWARTGLPAALTSATYDAANRLTVWDATSVSYDLNGNLANDGLTTYGWNARNQLTAMSGATSASFAYDAIGRRRLKTIGGTTTDFLYDGINLVQELAGSTPTANLLVGSNIDETFTRTDGTGTSTLLVDALGSTLELADASGALQTHYTFEPFGRTTTSGTSSTNALQFTGRESDDTGLYFNRARFYSASLQRWISEDPIEFAAGDVNLYAYVGNQATMWRDPNGLVKFALPLGHPCRWQPGRPGDGASTSKSDSQPPQQPPLSWWLMCSPTVVPDTIVPPDIRPGGDGWPRVTLDYHDTPHPFPWLGPQPHLQLNIWWDGVPGSGIAIRIPFPRLW